MTIGDTHRGNHLTLAITMGLTFVLVYFVKSDQTRKITTIQCMVSGLPLIITCDTRQLIFVLLIPLITQIFCYI